MPFGSVTAAKSARGIDIDVLDCHRPGATEMGLGGGEGLARVGEGDGLARGEGGGSGNGERVGCTVLDAAGVAELAGTSGP